MSLGDEKDLNRFVKAMRRILRIARYAESGLAIGDEDKCIDSIREVIGTAERAMESLGKERDMTWIEVERKRFREQFGMTYKNAERFAFRESLSGRKVNETLWKGIIRHAWLEVVWKEGVPK